MARVTRRAVLAGLALGLTSTAGCAGVGRSSTPEADRPAFDGWLSSTAAYDGIVDRTGLKTVTVAVGGGDGLSFEPAALHVDIDTTLRWEWTGGGAAHNVVATDGTFASDTHSEAGRTFQWTFDAAGLVKYLCVPHEYAGMKGVVLVGD